MNKAFEDELIKTLSAILTNKNNISYSNLKLLKYLSNKSS